MGDNQIAKPTVKLLYNGKDCTKDFSRYLNTLTFVDYEDEQSDELNITLNDSDGYFSTLWYPDKGDKLTCSISFPPFPSDLSGNAPPGAFPSAESRKWGRGF